MTNTQSASTLRLIDHGLAGARPAAIRDHSVIAAVARKRQVNVAVIASVDSRQLPNRWISIMNTEAARRVATPRLCQLRGRFRGAMMRIVTRKPMKIAAP